MLCSPAWQKGALVLIASCMQQHFLLHCCCCCCADSGLSGKVSKQQALALTEKLKALSRSTAAGGLQAYRDNAAAGGRGSRAGGQTVQQRQQPFNQDAAMTAEQLQEQREMDREREQVRGRQQRAVRLVCVCVSED